MRLAQVRYFSADSKGSTYAPSLIPLGSIDKLLKFTTSIILSLLLVSCSQRYINADLEERNGVAYLVNSSKPFSGRNTIKKDGLLVRDNFYQNGRVSQAIVYNEEQEESTIYRFIGTPEEISWISDETDADSVSADYWHWKEHDDINITISVFNSAKIAQLKALPHDQGASPEYSYCRDLGAKVYPYLQSKYGINQVYFDFKTFDTDRNCPSCYDCRYCPDDCSVD